LDKRQQRKTGMANVGPWTPKAMKDFINSPMNSEIAAQYPVRKKQNNQNHGWLWFRHVSTCVITLKKRKKQCKKSMRPKKAVADTPRSGH